MSLVVQKFGGTSVADCEKILAAARKAIRAQQEGHQVVMVVSAMGKNTDMLVELAGQITENPPAREMDMLLSTGEQVSVALMAMAIHSLGYKAISLTGGQIGIRTDSSHTKARIRSISTERVKQLLDQGYIVIAAGFQGIDEQFNITTLGRGGSDTTAVALAAVLQADQCEIYTDVDGVYTTDPRVLPEARLCAQVSYEEMLELASLGAGVMHSRSIEFGKKFRVPIRVRSSFSDYPGSLIASESEAPNMPVSGCALTKDEARITVIGVPDVPGVSRRLFQPLAERKITIDMVVQNVGIDGKANVSFTVPRKELKPALKSVHESIAGMTDSESNRVEVHSDDQVSKVSAVGLGMATQVGVANRMFRALADAQINLQMITTSEIKISVLVSREQALTAVRAVHQAFELAQLPAGAVTEAQVPTGQKPVNAVDVVARLQSVGMEDLMIHEVTLDETQAALSLSGVPNRSGVAAAIFQKLADAQVFIDMIVQSYFTDENANLTFTVPREQLAAAAKVAESFLTEDLASHVQSFPMIAKLCVSGIGLRSHTSVGSLLFEALAEAKINIRMMNTSEMRFNVVVDGSEGQLGLQALRATFGEYVR
ncbi:MAG: aspartate kinase [Pirellulaceae bacterium]|nr:aspartate kinase [Pirellulaceae bacterium]